MGNLKFKVEPEKKKKKRKVVEEEPVRKLIKKKKLKTELILPSKISKLNAKSVDSILGDSAEVIQQLLEGGHNDSASGLIYKRLLQSLVDLIPYAEDNIRKSQGQRGVYQLNTLITSIREVMTDVQSVKDRGALGDSLVEKVIRPSFLDIGMEIVKEDARLASAIKDLVAFDVYKQIKVEQKESLERLANTIKSKYEQAKSETVAFLQT